MGKVYLFDMDGTLIDSMPYFSRAILGMLEEEKLSYPPDIVKILTPLGYAGMAKYLVNMGARRPEQALMQAMGDYLLPAYEKEIPLKSGVQECLLRLKAQGGRLAVLTASPHRVTDPCLKRNGVWELFEQVWTTDDFGLTKSQPEIFLQAASKLGVQPEDVVFFDDNLGALETAKKAGMTTVGVYDASSDAYNEQIRSITDRYLLDYTEYTP